MVAEMGHKEVGGVKAKPDEDGHEAVVLEQLESTGNSLVIHYKQQIMNYKLVLSFVKYSVKMVLM